MRDYDNIMAGVEELQNMLLNIRTSRILLRVFKYIDLVNSRDRTVINQ